MDWDLYNAIRPLVDDGRSAGGVGSVRGATGDGEPVSGPLAGLEARALMAEGRAGEAAGLLRGVIVAGEADYWIHRHLAECLRDLGDWNGVAEATRRSHAALGWHESVTHGYVYTHDYFSNNIPDWEAWFATHVTAAPIAALEIGSWQGGSACWLLDRIVGPRGGRLTCIDTFAGSSEHAAWLAAVTAHSGRGIEALFDANIVRTGRATQVRKLVGRSQDTLPRLHGERFDFIYVDGAHEAKFVIQDAVQCWQMLAPGGCMLFDDVPFTFPGCPEQDTARAIDFFLATFSEDLEALARGRQMLLRRLA